MVAAVHEKVHARVIYQRRFVNVHIQPLVSFHLQRCLDTVFRERGLRHVPANVEFFRNLGNASFYILIFLSVKVSRNPPSLPVSGKGELGHLFFNYEIAEFLSVRKFITEAESVIEKPEPHRHKIACFALPKVHKQFVVVVAD